MIDNSGFIDNSSRVLSSDVRTNIQNKNLLQNKWDLYSNNGIISIGAEGKLLYQNEYDFADNINVGVDPAVDIKVRRSLDYSTSATAWENDSVYRQGTATFYPVDFLEKGENNVVTYQFTIIFGTNIVSLAPISFIKKKSFSNFTQINFTEGVNDDYAVYNPGEIYYYYRAAQDDMVRVSITQQEFNTGHAFEEYGFLYTRKLYAIYGVFHATQDMVKVVLAEDGIYGVYRQYNNNSWRIFDGWSSIKYTRIK